MKTIVNDYRVRVPAVVAKLVLSGTLCLLAGGAVAADAEIEELKSAIKALQTENRELAKRLATIESQRSAGPPVADSTARAVSESAKPDATQSPEQLARRIRELEISKAANEQATRLIIQDSLAKTGSKINDAVALGGAIEMLVGHSKDFSGTSTDALKLNTAELDLEVQVNPWVLGSFAIQYVDGTGLRAGSSAPSSAALNSSIDRINLDRAYFTLGDTQRFPLYLRVGRQPLPFGSSSGVFKADALSVDSPLTVEAFELKKTAIGLGFGLPTPVPARAGPPVFAPPVKPLLFSPLAERLAGAMGYKPPPTRLRPPNPVAADPSLPPFYGSVYLYESADPGATGRRYKDNVSARLGFRANGHCGRNYSELGNFGLCPWTLDINADYNSSIFESKFLASEYSAFASQTGAIKGMALNAKATLGRIALSGEWNGATQRAQFVDGLGNSVSIQPSAWAVSLGYQFDWNPWVTSIGGQGTFAAIGYSETRDLAGVATVSNGITSRAGALPKQRLTLTLGEWLMDGVKLVFEYSLIKDYPISDGGTDATGRSLAAVLTYAW